MSIPFLKRVDLIECLDKQNKNISLNEENILEAMHTFENQYAVSELLADLVLETLSVGRNEFTLSVKKFNLPFSKVRVKISTDNYLSGVNAVLEDVRINGLITISIILSKFDRLTKDNRNIFNALKNAIAHELMHGFSTWKQSVENDATNISFNDLYHGIIGYLGKVKKPDTTYKLIYSIYMIFDQELNAFVSQCYGEIEDAVSNSEILTNEIIAQSLYKSNIYNRYLYNKSVVDETLNLPEDELNISLENIIKALDIPSFQSIKQAKKMLKITLEQTNIAIKRCHKIAFDIKSQKNTTEK